MQFGDRQTDEQMDWTRPSHEAAIAIASGGLITQLIYNYSCIPNVINRPMTTSRDRRRLATPVAFVHEYNNVISGCN